MTPTEQAAIEQHKKFRKHIAMKAAELESRRVEIEPPKTSPEISPKLSPSNKFDKWVENWASDPANAYWILVANKPSTWLKYPPVKLIIGVVCRHFNIRRQDLLSQRRHAQYVWARQVGMFVAKEMTKKSLPEIGREFGDRDHTTVLHAVRKVDLRKDDPDVRFDLDEVRSQVMREFA